MSAFLETARVVLRDREPRDLAFLASLYADPQVMRYIGDGQTYDRGAVKARYARIDATIGAQRREPWDEFKILERKEDGVCVGQAGLLRCQIDGTAEVEVGWWLAPFAWGHGYATEAAQALCAFAFRELRLERLSVVLHAENVKSVAVAVRIGGLHAGTARYRDRSVTRYLVQNPRAAAREEMRR
jgi:RimJ/RimL family protein N-acetyltransferase